MVLKLDDKKAIVAELADITRQSTSVVAADYRGLTVSQMTALRTSARKAGVIMRVYRNTLVRRAVQKTNFACLTDALVGPLVLLFSQEDPAAAARVLRDFVKVNETLEVKALVLDGQLLPGDQLKAVASLPSREQALTQVAAIMKAPMSKFVRTLAEPYAQLVRVLAAIREHKEAA